MGYDPESFYGGGLAMLANGGSVDPDSAIDLFKSSQKMIFEILLVKMQYLKY